MSDARRPAVFLDRDDTLIEDPGYIRHPDQVRLLPRVGEALRGLRAAGFALVVVSNQSGVARGIFTEVELAAVHDRLRDLLRGEAVELGAIYYCPFLEGADAVVEEYRRDSALRKPGPGMLLLAAGEMNLDLGRSWMVGDSRRDIEAGRSAGCRTVLLSKRKAIDTFGADGCVENLARAVDLILDRRGSA